MFECPWSANQLKNLSRHIRDETEPPASLPTYAEVMLWYNEVAAQVQKDINTLDWKPLLGDRQWEVTSRAKTIDTLRDKLRRDTGTPLPSVQDVAGVRFEAEMSLDEQDAVARAIVGLYEQDENCLKDLRATPHSGYRAVHLWLRLPVRVEVQVRTHMQGAWANAYEAAADSLGRDIRYGSLPADETGRNIVLALQSLSTDLIAQAEDARNQMTRSRLSAAEMKGRGRTRLAKNLQSTLDKAWNDYVTHEAEMKQQLGIIHDQFRAIRGKG